MRRMYGCASRNLVRETLRVYRCPACSEWHLSALSELPAGARDVWTIQDEIAAQAVNAPISAHWVPTDIPGAGWCVAADLEKLTSQQARHQLRALRIVQAEGFCFECAVCNHWHCTNSEPRSRHVKRRWTIEQEEALALQTSGQSSSGARV